MVVEARRGWLSETSCEPAVNALPDPTSQAPACSPSRVWLNHPHLISFSHPGLLEHQTFTVCSRLTKIQDLEFIQLRGRGLFTPENAKLRTGSWGFDFASLPLQGQWSVTVSELPAGREVLQLISRVTQLGLMTVLHRGKKWLSVYNF